MKRWGLLDGYEYYKIVNPELGDTIVGKDGASNEMETPPEVFAPIFRFLKKEGLINTTYHVGEDFEHILSGLRAVNEAMLFLDLQSGDRIGHGTALGIYPEIITKNIHCKQGHWLDNLIWLTYIISNNEELIPYSNHIIPLVPHIQILYREIYGKNCPELPILWKAWQMRKLDISAYYNDINPISKHDLSEKKLLKDAKKKDELAFNEFLKYHSRYREKWNKKISLSKYYFDTDLLCAVQDVLVSQIRQKNIIIEVLPTSNVRISHYKTTEEHHLLRWLDDDNKRPVPQVVLGTDNPGIFSTNLRNEYSLLLNILQKKYSSSSEKPYQIIEHLIENGRTYKFRNDK